MGRRSRRWRRWCREDSDWERLSLRLVKDGAGIRTATSQGNESQVPPSNPSNDALARRDQDIAQVTKDDKVVVPDVHQLVRLFGHTVCEAEHVYELLCTCVRGTYAMAEPRPPLFASCVRALSSLRSRYGMA